MAARAAGIAIAVAVAGVVLGVWRATRRRGIAPVILLVVTPIALGIHGVCVVVRAAGLNCVGLVVGIMRSVAPHQVVTRDHRVAAHARTGEVPGGSFCSNPAVGPPHEGRIRTV